MQPDSTLTSPQRPGTAQGVYRLLSLHPSDRQRGALSKVLERPLLLSREGRPGAQHDGHELLVLEDAEVSRRHATLEPPQAGAQAWLLRDVGSHNGTFVNGQPIAETPVRDGDVIRVGRHVLLLQYLDLAASQRLTRRRLADSPLVGEGPACKAVDEQIVACATQPGPVLVLGESGTGKELVVQELHARSGRGGPLLPVNCTALGEAVADSELFGHVQGAFSGAVRSKRGLFAAAAGGSLFLDELGDLPLPLQAKLLRTIETGEIRRVGDDRVQRVDTRVLAATHVDLERAVEQGRFRGDLWARLQRNLVRVPPLRARRDDVLPLVRHFLRAAGSRQALDADAAEALVVHAFPYNVRELRHAVETTLQRARGDRTIGLEHLPAAIAGNLSRRGHGHAPALSSAQALGRPPETAEALRGVLEANGWNVAKVAALFGKDRKQIYRWCRTFGITLPPR